MTVDEPTIFSTLNYDFLSLLYYHLSPLLDIFTSLKVLKKN